ncbi:Nucleotide pyrophosphohydrolase [Vibrio chagasii]|nr:Nucleotide pyrophosphohydrolase [Vibrio chagasii]CAH7249268.1 Nucleotide pyrophosphohydrolase [Vibrio chagasii]CAH7267961.1 Nucleotide pyrophosphohydrolase [Vibrio chagasii]CAH7455292.1 Nucleotide pyrophosphohydrolase [Vibrio chagasii]
MNELKKLQSDLAEFANDRDWDKFHSPKNLAMALAGEVGEVLEHFQWLTKEQSQNLTAQQRSEVGEELADVFIYLLRLADKTGIDLIDESNKKLAINAMKYPVNKSYGVSTKYTKL